MNRHKHCKELAIEFKRATGMGWLSSVQSEYLRCLEDNGYKCLVSSNYDKVLKEIIEKNQLFPEDVSSQKSQCKILPLTALAYETL